MQFSTYDKNLDYWQGASLIFGVLEEEIASQLENIKFVVDPKLLLKKVTQKKFKGEILTEWRDRIYNHQIKISKDTHNKTFHQTSLPINTISDERKIDPFSLQPLSLNFWRTNQYIHDGPAMYFVIDSMESSKIILYIGETNSANKRWKGEHDCKNYLINYKEALAHNLSLIHI